MSPREVRLGETWNAISGPLARLERSLHEDREAVMRAETIKSGHDLMATDAFLQRFQQVTDLALRKLFPRLLAVLESSDMRHPLGVVLDRLDGYEILADVPWWLELNETRNRLIHEYAMGLEIRAAELANAWAAADRLRIELRRIREDGAMNRRFPTYD